MSPQIDQVVHIVNLVWFTNNSFQVSYLTNGLLESKFYNSVKLPVDLFAIQLSNGLQFDLVVLTIVPQLDPVILRVRLLGLQTLHVDELANADVVLAQDFTKIISQIFSVENLVKDLGAKLDLWSN